MGMYCPDLSWILHKFNVHNMLLCKSHDSMLNSMDIESRAETLFPNKDHLLIMMQPTDILVIASKYCQQIRDLIFVRDITDNDFYLRNGLGGL